MIKAISRVVIISLLTLFAMGTSPNARGAEKAAPPAKVTQAKKIRGVPFRGKITAIDKIARTITLGGKVKERVLVITSQTRLFKAGKPAVLGDVIVGEQVRGQMKTVDGKKEVLSLFIGAKAPAKEKSKKNLPASTAAQ